MKQFAFTLLFFCYFSFVSSSSSAQVFNNLAIKSEVQKGLDLMYNMEYDAAELVFLSIEDQMPDHPVGPFMKAMNRWWQTYISINTDHYYEFIEEQLDLALKNNQSLAKQAGLEQEHTFFSFMSYALLGRLQAYRGEYLPAIGSARKVIGPLKKSIKYVGKQPEFYMVAGLYHYYVATYGDFYPIVKPLLYFFPDGNKELGLQEMQLAASTESFTQTEAGFFLGYIYLDELPDEPKGLEVTRQLSIKYPKNTWFETDYARALLLTQQYGRGEAIIDRLIQNYESQSGHSSRNISSLESRHTTHLMIKVYHYKGFAVLFGKKNIYQAMSYFDKSDNMARLALVEEDAFLVGNRYYTGVCHDNLQQRGKAIQAYEESLEMDDNFYYKEKAKQAIKTPVVLE